MRSATCAHPLLRLFPKNKPLSEAEAGRRRINRHCFPRAVSTEDVLKEYRDSGVYFADECNVHTVALWSWLQYFCSACED